MIPSWLEFIQLSDPLNVPLIWQLLILEFAIDGLRLAAVNTPNMLTTPLSVIAGIVLGEYAVKSGWFNSETMLYMAFVTVANYSQASFELGYAMKFMRILILILTALFGIWGYAAGMVLTICAIIFNRTDRRKKLYLSADSLPLEGIKEALFQRKASPYYAVSSRFLWNPE